MKNVMCAITPTELLGPHDIKQGTTRSVYITNNSSTESIWIQFDADMQSQLSPILPSGLQIVPKATQVLRTEAPGGRDGFNAVWGCSATGLAIATIQVVQGGKTLP